MQESQFDREDVLVLREATDVACVCAWECAQRHYWFNWESSSQNP